MRPVLSFVVIASAVATLLPAVPAAAACPSSDGATIAPAPSPAGDVVFRGGGLGHGLGMSQLGANGAAALGCGHRPILETYYTGAQLSTRDGGDEVVVGIVDPSSHQRSHSAAIDVTATADQSLGARAVDWQVGGCADAADCASSPPAQQPGERWRIIPDSAGAFRAYRFGADGVRQAKPFWRGGAEGARLTALHDGAVLTVKPMVDGKPVNERVVRWGQLEIVTSGSTTSGNRGWSTSWVLQRITPGRDRALPTDDRTHTGLDRYLWGLHEVSSSFEPAAQRAQAVAARTYAMRRVLTGLRSSCACHVVTTPADQNWVGWSHESDDIRFGDGVWREQVKRTSGQVMTYGGNLITAMYSASHGGQTESNTYVFGTAQPGYLQPVDDSRWDLATDRTRWKNGYRAWARGFTWAELRTKLGGFGARAYGEVVDVAVPAPVGHPDRADPEGAVRVTGRRGGAVVNDRWTGWHVRQALGLPSPNFTIEVVPTRSAAAVPLAGDWDGDGSDELGWFDAGRIALRMSNGTVVRYRFGRAGDAPVVADFDGDGIDTVSVTRDRRWFINNGQDDGPADGSFVYGRLTDGDVPLAGDWDGDGVDSVGIVRRGEWHLRNDVAGGAGQVVFIYGRVLRGDIPLTGDWRRSGADQIAIVRADEWHLRYRLAGGPADRVFRYGNAELGDRPVTGDWDGDGDDTTGIVRGSTWLLRNDLRGGAAEVSVNFAG